MRAAIALIPFQHHDRWQSLPLRLFIGIILLALHGMSSAARLELLIPAPLDEKLRPHITLPESSESSESSELSESSAQSEPFNASAHPALLRRLRQELGELLATEGYFTPEIQLRTAANDATLLQVVVTPGPQTRVSEIELHFSGALAGDAPEQAERRKKLQQGWRLPVAAPFRSADWEAAKTAMLAAVSDEDYALARITGSQATVDPAHQSAQLSLSIDSGPSCLLGDIHIHGLRRYAPGLVKKQATFAVGAPWRRDAVLGFQARLQNTPWFSSVEIDTTPATLPEAMTATEPKEAHARLTLPVQVHVSEAPARRLGFGIGYGTNTGARGEINFTHHDLFERAWNLESALRLEQKRQTASAELGFLAHENARLSLGGKFEQSDIAGLITSRALTSLRRTRLHGHIETRQSLEWQREERRPLGAPPETGHALMLDWRWIHRRIDDPLAPRDGHVIELGIGGASRRLLSDRDFVRSYLRAQHWWPLTRNDQLTLRGEVGLTAAQSRFGIPQDYLFRSGGAYTVRGYNYQSLGVREGQAVVGGRALIGASAEYTHWFNGPWGMAWFIDAGDAADDWNSLHPVVGTGLGARWQSPAGPLALDLAHGQKNKQWQLHFSLSVAF